MTGETGHCHTDADLFYRMDGKPFLIMEQCNIMSCSLKHVWQDYYFVMKGMEFTGTDKNTKEKGFLVSYSTCLCL